MKRQQIIENFYNLDNRKIGVKQKVLLNHRLIDSKESFFLTKQIDDILYLEVELCYSSLYKKKIQKILKRLRKRLNIKTRQTFFKINKEGVIKIV